MVGTNASTNKNHKFYNSMVYTILRIGGDFATKFGALCVLFFVIVFPVKTLLASHIDRKSVV